MNITIRKAQTRDIPEILKMNESMNEPGCSTFEHMKHSLENNKTEIVLVAVHNDTAIGFTCGQLHHSICYANGTQCEVMELYVHEKYRRLGIATKLLNQLEQEFAKHNPQEIYLQTGKRNTHAQKFYESNGYTVRERVVYLKNKGR